MMPPEESQRTILKPLQWRYAVKKFDNARKINPADWETLEAALVLSPSAYGLQPWKFLVIDSSDVRKVLTSASWGQTQVEECSHFVVFTSKTTVDEAYIERFISQVARIRQISTEKLADYRKMIIDDVVKGPRHEQVAEWTARQAYLALGNLLATAAALNIDACPMEGIDTDKYDQILGLHGTGFRTLCACAMGYRSPTDTYAAAAKVRFERSDIIEHIGALSH